VYREVRGMVNREAAKALIKTYFPGASEEQVEVLLKELTQEFEVFAHAKTRELVNQKRFKEN
jgi:hypothetical protein